MSVLILAPHGDEHAVPVRQELERRGLEVHVLDLAEIPRHARVSVAFDGVGVDPGARVERAVDPFDLDDVESVWMRRLSAPNPPILKDRGWAVSECHNLFSGLAMTLTDRRWVNPPEALSVDGGRGKLWQLQEARRARLEVPRTLASNDPERVRAFVASCGEAGAVYKPFASRPAIGPDGNQTAIYTMPVNVGMDFATVAHAPGIFQERVAKRVEIRATVMGERVFAIEVHSQDDPRAALDFRHRIMDVPHAQHALPPEVEGRILALHRALGLVFGTCDLILTPEGRYVFLETNQCGQWLWCATKTGLDLVGPFCDLLTGE